MAKQSFPMPLAPRGGKKFVAVLVLAGLLVLVMKDPVGASGFVTGAADAISIGADRVMTFLNVLFG